MNRCENCALCKTCLTGDNVRIFYFFIADGIVHYEFPLKKDTQAFTSRFPKVWSGTFVEKYLFFARLL
jgi:hypothetical protein